MMSSLRGWRTIFVFSLSALAYVLAWPTLTQYVPGQWLATATALVGIGMRLITTTPPGSSTPAPGP